VGTAHQHFYGQGFLQAGSLRYRSFVSLTPALSQRERGKIEELFRTDLLLQPGKYSSARLRQAGGGLL